MARSGLINENIPDGTDGTRYHSGFHAGRRSRKAIYETTSSAAPVLLNPLERRLSSEWEILQALARSNSGRLTDLAAHDGTFRLTLRNTPALLLPLPEQGAARKIVTDHPLRIHFSRFFPAAPMELYLNRPVEHPNVHPETGFVCLWDRHRVSNTVEDALGKTIAILGWQLHNEQPVHVMQPAALHRMRTVRDEMVRSLASPFLASAFLGGSFSRSSAREGSAAGRRRRLS